MLQYHTHLEVTNLFSLIAMRLTCGNDGVGGHESVDSCTMVEVESLEMVELVCVGRLLKMLKISQCLFVNFLEVGKLWEQNRLPWEHSAEC